ncbi:MAG: NAD-dependent epimerase/dehydratase family protein [Candidatus Acidiferrales bacterium]
MKIFIAGATGVLGRQLIQQFTERGNAVICLARSAANEITIRKQRGESRQADLFDADSLARAAEGADVVIHAATAIPTNAKPRPEDWKTNDRIRIDGTRALAEAAAKVGAKQFLVQSITWVARPADQSAFDENTPPHTDFVTRSTLEMETIAREAGSKHGFGVGILRCAWFHSPDAAHTRYFGEQLAARKLPVIGKGDAIWQFIHVDDAASAFVTLAEAKRSGLWHVTDEQPVASGVYLSGFAHRLGAPAPRHVPAWIAKVAAGSAAVGFMTSSTRTSNARFRQDFNWKPRYPSYREALDQIVGEWRRENFLGLRSKIAA